jgi:hypothetical protein
VQGISLSGNLFFDPVATGLMTSDGATGVRGRANEDDAGGLPARRGKQTAAEQKALRAASLRQVSRDLERMLRERMR